MCIDGNPRTLAVDPDNTSNLISEGSALQVVPQLARTLFAAPPWLVEGSSCFGFLFKRLYTSRMLSCPYLRWTRSEPGEWRANFMENGSSTPSPIIAVMHVARPECVRIPYAARILASGDTGGYDGARAGGWARACMGPQYFTTVCQMASKCLAKSLPGNSASKRFERASTAAQTPW